MDIDFHLEPDKSIKKKNINVKMFFSLGSVMVKSSSLACVYVCGYMIFLPSHTVCQLVSWNKDTQREILPLPCAALTQNLADRRIVHVREGLENPPALVLGPHHEGIHGSFDVA